MPRCSPADRAAAISTAPEPACGSAAPSAAARIRLISLATALLFGIRYTTAEGIPSPRRQCRAAPSWPDARRNTAPACRRSAARSNSARCRSGCAPGAGWPGRNPTSCDMHILAGDAAEVVPSSAMSPRSRPHPFPETRRADWPARRDGPAATARFAGQPRRRNPTRDPGRRGAHPDQQTTDQPPRMRSAAALVRQSCTAGSEFDQDLAEYVSFFQPIHAGAEIGQP